MNKERSIIRFKRFILNEWAAGNVADFLSRKSISLDEHLKRCSPINYIDGIGIWSDSFEGVDFWRRLNIKWLEILKSQKGENTTIKNLKSIW